MNLAAIIAKQKATQNAPKDSAVPASGNVADSAVPVSESAGPVVPAPAKLKFGIKKAGTSQPEAKATGPVEVVKPAQVSQVADAPLSLDDIENEDGTLAPVDDTPRGQYAFADEIPSTAPIRELPEDMTDLMKSFVVQLDSIYEVVHDPELSGQMIRVIMQELQENPDYIKLIADQDVHTMIRSLRDSMGLARIKKAEKSTKARGSRKAPATTAIASTLDDMFNADDF